MDENEINKPEQPPNVYFVKTNNGLIRGFMRNDTSVFLGIPYGDRCDEKKRFMAPRPAPKWKDMLDCTKIGPISMQHTANPSELPQSLQTILQEYTNHFTGVKNFSKEEEVMNENCLVLNVVTPAVDTNKRPVMVYIHGGGFMSGSGSVIAATSSQFVKEEDIVVVSINHRLNLFGGLYLGFLDEEYEQSGIVGLLDLILALQWVKDNINQFGGDPENVCLIGESGGGMKISNLMSMPKAKGLFSKAIIISGACKAGVKSKEMGTKETLQIMDKLGISPIDWEKILELPAEKLLEAIKGVKQMEEGFVLPFFPTADEIDLPYNEEKIYQVYEGFESVSVLVGASEEELSTYMNFHEKITWEGIRTELLEQKFSKIISLPGITEDTVDSVIDVFRQVKGDKKKPWQILVQIVSLSYFLGGSAYKMAIARADDVYSSVWHYMTTYESPIPGRVGLLGSWHTADLPLIFRNVFHQEAEELSKTIAHAFASFARKGTPSTEQLIWLPFTKKDKQTLLFDEVSVCKANPYKEIYQILAKAKLPMTGE